MYLTYDTRYNDLHNDKGKYSNIFSSKILGTSEVFTLSLNDIRNYNNPKWGVGLSAFSTDYENYWRDAESYIDNLVSLYLPENPDNIGHYSYRGKLRKNGIDDYNKANLYSMDENDNVKYYDGKIKIDNSKNITVNLYPDLRNRRERGDKSQLSGVILSTNDSDDSSKEISTNDAIKDGILRIFPNVSSESEGDINLLNEEGEAVLKGDLFYEVESDFNTTLTTKDRYGFLTNYSNDKHTEGIFPKGTYGGKISKYSFIKNNTYINKLYGNENQLVYYNKSSSKGIGYPAKLIPVEDYKTYLETKFIEDLRSHMRIVVKFCVDDPSKREYYSYYIPIRNMTVIPNENTIKLLHKHYFLDHIIETEINLSKYPESNGRPSGYTEPIQRPLIFKASVYFIENRDSLIPVDYNSNVRKDYRVLGVNMV